MVDLHEVQVIEADKLNKELESNRSYQLRRLKERQEKFVEEYNSSLLQKEKAEKNFPHFLKRVEEDIRRSAVYGSNEVVITIERGTVDTPFSISMLIPILSMSGFICQFNDNGHLKIRW